MCIDSCVLVMFQSRTFNSVSVSFQPNPRCLGSSRVLTRVSWQISSSQKNVSTQTLELQLETEGRTDIQTHGRTQAISYTALT